MVFDARILPFWATQRKEWEPAKSYKTYKYWAWLNGYAALATMLKNGLKQFGRRNYIISLSCHKTKLTHAESRTE